jgi:hypothetical protein
VLLRTALLGAMSRRSVAAEDDPSDLFGRQSGRIARSRDCNMTANVHTKQVIVIKRSMSPGFAGIDDDLFYLPNTSMLFDDAKEAAADIAAEIQQL